jgi:hypothetical protein
MRPNPRSNVELEVPAGVARPRLTLKARRTPAASAGRLYESRSVVG